MAASRIPSTMKRIMVNKLSTNFRDVTEIVQVPVPKPGANEVLVKNNYAGINASDINYTAGRYDPTVKPPFPVGFEGIGEVVAVGPDCTVKVGQHVAYLASGAFVEYRVLPDKMVIPFPSSDPAFLSTLASGLTASIALEKEGDLKPNKTVLVTAAAGGTGQFAVQIAKEAGCHVIGTCSSEEKAEFLKSIGCHRPVIYKKESLDEVLSKEYPKGVDVVYESVGKDMLDAALKNLAIFGRIIVIGSISGYHTGDQTDSAGFLQMKDQSTVNIPMTLLAKSASLRGFFLSNYISESQRHVKLLTTLYAEGKLKLAVDKGEKESTGPFVGLEKVADAVEHLYSRKSIGKIVVQLGNEDKSAL